VGRGWQTAAGERGAQGCYSGIATRQVARLFDVFASPGTGRVVARIVNLRGRSAGSVTWIRLRQVNPIVAATCSGTQRRWEQPSPATMQSGPSASRSARALDAHEPLGEEGS
jgi:hypothetical protein